MRPTLLVPVAVIVLAVAVVGGFVLLTRDDEPAEKPPAPPRARLLVGPPEAPFALRHPTSWRVAPEEEGSTDRRRPLAVLRRSDGSAVLTISARGRVEGGLGRLRRELPRELRERFADFRLQSSRIIRVAAGPALYTSWIRTESGQIQANLVVPTARRLTFSLDAVLRADARDAAQELARIYGSFGLRPG